MIAENQFLTAVDKPSGLITHSDGRTIEPSLAEWLIERYPERADIGEPWVSPQGESIRVAGLVHRLDRATSGVLIAAKTAPAFSFLREEFRARRVSKTYRALVYGHIREDAGVVSAEIVRTSSPPKRWEALPRDITHHRTAITEWRILACGSYEGVPVSLIELYPRTGRTHQLRVHVAHIGHPVLSDPLYAGPHAAVQPCRRLMLHAYACALTHPDGSRGEYVAPMPAEFAAFIPDSDGA